MGLSGLNSPPCESVIRKWSSAMSREQELPDEDVRKT